MNNQPCHDGGEVSLLRLQDELAKRGLKSELHTRGVVARLRVFSHGEVPDRLGDFENTVLAACFGQDLWFAWPWAEPIARVSQVARAADEIIDALGSSGRDSLL